MFFLATGKLRSLWSSSNPGNIIRSFHAGTANFRLLLRDNVDARWTSEGREFAFSFTPIFNWTAAGQPSICQLVVTSRQVGIVRVQADAVALDQTYSVSPNMRTIINLGTALRPSGVGYEKKAVYVTSDVDVALFAFSSVTPVGTSGGQQSGYLVYPPVNGKANYLLFGGLVSLSTTVIVKLLMHTWDFCIIIILYSNRGRLRSAIS